MSDAFPGGLQCIHIFTTKMSAARDLLGREGEGGGDSGEGGRRRREGKKGIEDEGERKRRERLKGREDGGEGGRREGEGRKDGTEGENSVKERI